MGFGSWITTINAQCLFLVSILRDHSWHTQGSICSTGNWTQIGCMQSKCFHSYTISLALALSVIYPWFPQYTNFALSILLSHSQSLPSTPNPVMDFAFEHCPLPDRSIFTSFDRLHIIHSSKLSHAVLVDLPWLQCLGSRQCSSKMYRISVFLSIAPPTPPYFSSMEVELLEECIPQEKNQD